MKERGGQGGGRRSPRGLSAETDGGWETLPPTVTHTHQSTDRCKMRRLPKTRAADTYGYKNASRQVHADSLTGTHGNRETQNNHGHKHSLSPECARCFYMHVYTDAGRPTDIPTHTGPTHTHTHTHTDGQRLTGQTPPTTLHFISCPPYPQVSSYSWSFLLTHPPLRLNGRYGVSSCGHWSLVTASLCCLPLSPHPAPSFQACELGLLHGFLSWSCGPCPKRGCQAVPL